MQCIVCSSPDLRKAQRVNGYQLHRYHRCTHLFVSDSINSEVLDKVYDRAFMSSPMKHWSVKATEISSEPWIGALAGFGAGIALSQRIGVGLDARSILAARSAQW